MQKDYNSIALKNILQNLLKLFYYSDMSKYSYTYLYTYIKYTFRMHPVAFAGFCKF